MMDKKQVRRIAGDVLYALAVAVAYFALTAGNGVLTLGLAPWFIAAASYFLITLGLGVLISRKDFAEAPVSYLVVLVGIAVVMGSIATSSLLQGLVSNPYVLLFAAALLVPDIMVFVLLRVGQLVEAPDTRQAPAAH